MVLKFLTEFFNVLHAIILKHAIKVKVNPKEKSFECEVVTSCKNCLRKITQIKNYSSGINNL